MEETPREQAWALPNTQLDSGGESVAKGVKRPAPAPEACSDGVAQERRTVIVKRPKKTVKGNFVDIASLKVAELREELRARGLPKSGNKSVLVSRLQAYLADLADDQNPRKRKK